MDPLILENRTLRLAFDRRTGALVGLTALPGGWPILERPHLGLSFRLLTPLPGERRNNPVFGERQTVTAVETTPDRRRAVFRWDGVQSEHGGRHDIALTLEVTLTECQAVFTLAIANHSRVWVENVYSPYLGDVSPPADASWFKALSPAWGGGQEWDLWPHYRGLRGYHGVDHPTQFAATSAAVGAPMTPFILLRGDRQGLYAGVNAPSAELVAWHTELRPGCEESMDGRVPSGGAIGGRDVALRFAAVHVPFIPPGESRTLTPIALEAFQGDWQAGADIYRRWRDTWMRRSAPPAWAREPHAWQLLHINSPEDERRVLFRDLVRCGEECARHGVRALHLAGWNDGGQDQGNPSHDPDPRLGGHAALREAIARIRRLGVKVILFAKFTWADRATERFRRELIRWAIKDPYGDYYQHYGYQYQTATQLLDINTKRLVPMCFLCEAYRRVCDEEFAKILALGADGMLFDESLHHAPALLCFDPAHGHRVGAPVYAEDRALIARFARLARPVNPDFLFAGEACYDWEFEVYHLSYHRSAARDHVPLTRYLLPEAPLMTAVTGFDDRNMINQCLLYRYLVSYEPYHFKGRLDDYPLTLAYGKQMDALRAEQRAYFWDGVFRGTAGARATREESPHHPYAVFTDPVSGASAVAVANYDARATVCLRVTLDNGQPLRRYRRVDDPAWRASDAGIVLPPRSAAVVLP